MRILNPSRANFFFWFSFISFASVAGVLLFFSQPLFLYKTGVKVSLLAEAKKLRGMPLGVITKNVGGILKEYLDASKHTSRADIHVSDSTPDNLSIDILLPWAEVSAKKRRQRAELVCRLGSEMLESARAKNVILLVNLLRMTKDSTDSEPVGAMVYSPKDKECIWKG